MANQFDRRRISVKGGGLLQLREIDPTPTTSFSTIGFISATEFLDSHTLVESIDDKGDFIDTKSGARAVSLKTTLMQTTKEEIDWMKNAEGKYFEAYYKVTLNNGQIQELVMPVCRVKPGVELSFQSATQRTIALEVHVLAPATALTRTPSAYNSAQWVPYVLTEGGSANGAPSDAATVPQAAI